MIEAEAPGLGARFCAVGIDESSMSMQADIRGAIAQRIREAFSGLGYACAALLFLTVGTAVWWMCGLFKHESAVQIVASVATASLNFALVLLVPLLVVVGAANLAPAAGVRRVFVVGATTLFAVVSCIVLARAFPLADWDPTSGPTGTQLAELVVMLVLLLEFRHRTLATASVLLRSEIDAVAADARLQRVRLDVLRAQIAPHFLFNTLANVRRLARVDRKAAASMLGDLSHYFSITLARRNDGASTLATEVALVDAYLRIHRIRMGARLAYTLRLPAELGGARLPPMMLLTLVENAIKHGIDPLVEGGCVEIAAQRQGAMLQLEVADNGRGMASSEGHGMGLANIRARLAMLYGSRARLSLAHRQPRGFVASVQLPLEYVR